MRKHYWPGVLLIVVGILLLMDEMNLLSLNWYDILFYGFMLIGLVKLNRGWGRADKKGIMGGTFFFAFGLLMVLISHHYLPSTDEFVFAVFFLCLALANLVLLLVRRDRWSHLIWVVIFGGIGGLFLGTYCDYYSRWYLYDMFSTYWPVVIILCGAFLLWRGLKNHHALT
jgi:hypothetical protein